MKAELRAYRAASNRPDGSELTSMRSFARPFAHALGLVALILSVAPRVGAADRTTLESYTCKSEAVLVEKAKEAIADPNAKINWHEYRDILRPDQFTTTDGRTIHGLVWKAARPQGYLLVAQGTSMLAAEIYEVFQGFRELDLDVYVYDFRGYGPSTGNTSLQALMADYKQRIAELNARPEYRYQILYGISLGGVIFTKIAAENIRYSALVLDSVPHAIPWYAGCPDAYDPVENLPKLCSNWFVIAGGRDKVIGSRARKLLKKTASCKAQGLEKKSYGHIFTDNVANTRERLQKAAAFINTTFAAQDRRITQ